MSLIYDKTEWKDDKSTPINARNLNNIEDGIEYIYHKWDKIIQDSTTGNHASELIDARYGPSDTEQHPTLGHRLNHMDSKFEDITSQLEHIENEIDTDLLKVHFIQRALNKADCMLIETNENNTLIDIGWETDSNNLVNYLKSKNITKIDNIIISHYHDDHVGGYNAEGFANFINSDLDFTNCKVYLPHKHINYNYFVDNVGNGVANRIQNANNFVLNYIDKKGLNIYYPYENEILSLNKTTNIKFLNCNPSYFNDYYSYTLSSNDIENNYTNYNNFSLVCELTHNNIKFLFSSDVEIPAQKNILNDISNDIDVYKVEHHGANKSTYKDFLYKINPNYAIVMNRNVLGMKDKMTQSYLHNKGCKIYDTNTAGDIVIKSNGSIVNIDAPGGQSKINAGMYYVGHSYELERGFPINENDNLNDYKTFGVYYCENTTILNTLQGLPEDIGDGGFRLVVQSRNSNQSPMHLIYDVHGNIFTRTYSNENWNNWINFNKKKEILQVGLSTNYNTTSVNKEKLTLDNIIYSNEGEGLIVSDGNIVIGKGVSVVKINGQVGWGSSSDGSDVFEAYVHVNNKVTHRNAVSPINTYYGVSIQEKIIRVSEGDVITLYARSRINSNKQVTCNIDSTWLKVEVV